MAHHTCEDGGECLQWIKRTFQSARRHCSGKQPEHSILTNKAVQNKNRLDIFVGILFLYCSCNKECLVFGQTAQPGKMCQNVTASDKQFIITISRDFSPLLQPSDLKRGYGFLTVFPDSKSDTRSTNLIFSFTHQNYSYCSLIFQSGPC